MKAKVYITPREGVLDPQGKAVMGALGALGFKEVRGVKVGRFIVVELACATNEEAERRVGEMCEKILANTVIEDYTIEIES